MTAQSQDLTLIEQSIKYYSDGKYDSSKVLLQQLVDQDYQSFELYYNLGNSYYKLNQVEEAILYYEKARKLNPKDEDLLFNLELANARITDHIPMLPGSKFVENVIGALKTDQWAVISVSAFFIFLLFLLLFLATANGALKSLSLFAFSIMGVCALLTFSFATVSKSSFDDRKSYIVFESAVNVSSAPNISGKQLFVIHKGLKIEWLQESGEYAKIKLPDGNIGWVVKRSIKEI